MSSKPRWPEPQVQIASYREEGEFAVIVRPTPSPDWLVILAGKRYVLDDVAIVGTDPSCAIVVGDPSLAPRHAELTPTADGVRLRDLGSNGGIHVDGQLVEDHTLRGGERIQIGSLVFEIEDARVLFGHS